MCKMCGYRNEVRCLGMSMRTIGNTLMRAGALAPVEHPALTSLVSLVHEHRGIVGSIVRITITKDLI
mgnify:CR=1 FL=1